MLADNGILVYGHDLGNLMLYSSVRVAIHEVSLVLSDSFPMHVHNRQLITSSSIVAVGHGRSEGDRVHVETMDTYVMDVIQHVEIMKKQYPDLPSFIMGHSMVCKL